MPHIKPQKPHPRFAGCAAPNPSPAKSTPAKLDVVAATEAKLNEIVLGFETDMRQARTDFEAQPSLPAYLDAVGEAVARLNVKIDELLGER